MTFSDYEHLFTAIIEGHYTEEPYADPLFLNYTRLNEARQKRWLKTIELNKETIEAVYSIYDKQYWILITEPWCGDAAHSVPCIKKMAELNDAIHLDIELRDSEPFTINNYLTNGGISIPILIARDEDGNDLWKWGPRPAECQHLFLKNKQSDMSNEEQKLALQNWYNADSGQSIQREITGLITATQEKINSAKDH